MDGEKFIVLSNEGNEVVCDILFTFKNEATDKEYVVYTDNTKDEEGNVRVYASTYKTADEEKGLQELEAVETEKEWKLIETILKTAEEEITKEE